MNNSKKRVLLVSIAALAAGTVAWALTRPRPASLKKSKPPGEGGKGKLSKEFQKNIGLLGITMWLLLCGIQFAQAQRSYPVGQYYDQPLPVRIVYVPVAVPVQTSNYPVYSSPYYGDYGYGNRPIYQNGYGNPRNGRCFQRSNCVCGQYCDRYDYGNNYPVYSGRNQPYNGRSNNYYYNDYNNRIYPTRGVPYSQGRGWVEAVYGDPDFFRKDRYGRYIRR